MATPTQKQASSAVLVVTLLLGAPACAATIVGARGKPLPREAPRNPLIEIGSERPRPEVGSAEANAALPESYVTVLIHLNDLSADERARLLAERDRLFPPPKGEPCDCVVFPPTDTIIITGLRSEIEHLLHRPIRKDQ